LRPRLCRLACLFCHSIAGLFSKRSQLDRMRQSVYKATSNQTKALLPTSVVPRAQDYTQILAHREGQIKASEARLGTLVAQNEALAAAQKERDATVAKQAAAIAAYDERREDARTLLVDKERLEEQVAAQMEVRGLERREVVCCLSFSRRDLSSGQDRRCTRASVRVALLRR
jgi:hypothetical protein